MLYILQPAEACRPGSWAENTTTTTTLSDNTCGLDFPAAPTMPKQDDNDHASLVEAAFDQFFTAVTCKSILSSFQQLLDVTGLRHVDHCNFYTRLKEQLKSSWKAQSLWAKLDKRAAHRDYGRGRACANTKVSLVITLVCWVWGGGSGESFGRGVGQRVRQSSRHKH